MKRIGDLYGKIISLDNLRLADEKARRGKRKSYGVRAHDRHREANLLKLHEALLTKTFRTSRYDLFTIYEPKERIIYRLPYYPDRIVHHAIMNILEPIWTRTFTHNTFSCIKGRGIEGCARHVERTISKYEGRPLFCLKIDIKKFYPSIDHDVLKNIIKRKIKDRDLLWLLGEIIDSADGLPIGNYLSQYLANLYFSPFMHYVNEVLKLDCEEYADDIVFYADSKERLWQGFGPIRDYIEGRLHLTIKDNWQIFPVAESRYDKSGRALDYVGYCFYRHHKALRKSIKQNLCRETARLAKAQHKPSERAYKRRISPWLGWAQHSNSKHLLKSLIPNEYASIL